MNDPNHPEHRAVAVPIIDDSTAAPPPKPPPPPARTPQNTAIPPPPSPRLPTARVECRPPDIVVDADMEKNQMPNSIENTTIRPPPPPPRVPKEGDVGSVVSEMQKFFEQRELIRTESRSPVRKSIAGTIDNLQTVQTNEGRDTHEEVVSPPKSRKGSILSRLFGSTDHESPVPIDPSKEELLSVRDLSDFFENQFYRCGNPSTETNTLRRSQTVPIAEDNIDRERVQKFEHSRWNSTPELSIHNVRDIQPTKPFRRASLAGRRRHSVSFYSKGSPPHSDARDDMLGGNSFCSFDSVAEGAELSDEADKSDPLLLLRSETMYGYL